MARLGRKWSVLLRIEPEATSRAYQVRVSLLVLALSAMGIGLGVVVFSAALVVAGRNIAAGREVFALRAENDSLRLEFGRLAHIEEELQSLRDTNQQLLRLAGVVAPEDTSDTAKWYDNGGNALHNNGLRHPFLTPYVGTVSKGDPGGARPAGHHPGVDVEGVEGSLIVAAGNGVVVSAEHGMAEEIEIRIDHGDGIETVYGRTSEGLVAPGDTVQAGQAIARLGRSAREVPPRFHFEIRVDGLSIDPGKYIEDYRSTNP